MKKRILDGNMKTLCRKEEKREGLTCKILMDMDCTGSLNVHNLITRAYIVFNGH